jgi:predicted dehydrogenase
VGTMGQHHVRILSQSADVTLAGFYDANPDRSDEICRRHGCLCFSSVEETLENVDALTVAAPTSLHAEIGEQCLKRGIHVLMEKPLTHSVESAARLLDVSRESGVVLMVGHVERYNPAVGMLMELLRSKPEEIISIDARRLTPFDGSRCMDVDVLYDLLIHDIDLALEIADSDIAHVSASGRPVFSKQTDVAHTRIEFRNQAVAVFWTAKCSPKKERTIAITTPTRYFTADTLSRSLTVYTAEHVAVEDSDVCFMGDVRCEEVPVPDEEPLRREIDDFIQAVQKGERPLVDGERALKSMKALDLVAQSISNSRQ